MDIASLDLNLLKVFDALYTERSVTAAGKKIGLAQSSISGALARLRAEFDDELFVSTSVGMKPTQRAQALAPKIVEALNIIRAVREPNEIFDPKGACLTFKIATSDLHLAQIGILMMTHFEKLMPNLNLRFELLSKKQAFTALDEGRLDFIIGVYEQIPARFYQRDVITDEFVCIVRKDHPIINNKLTLEDFCNTSHVLMTLHNDEVGVVDTALAAKGLKRRVAITVSMFSVVPAIVSKTNYIATIPKSLADSPLVTTDCQVYSVPLSLDDWQMTVIWSKMTIAEAPKRYVLEQILNVIKTVP